MRDASDLNAYLSAVATIIEDIEKGEKKSLIDISEDLKVSLGTISNAKNKKASLNAMYLARMGRKYGSGYLNPYFALFNAQAAPLEKSQMSDVLPTVLSLAHKIALARDPEGPGGATEVPQEKRGYLPDLKKVNQRTGCLIAEIETGV